MSRHFSIAHILLWLFVIVLAIVIGGGLYEALVVVPLWSGAPPESVLAYYHHNVANPQFVLNQGGRFWLFFTPLNGLLAIAVLISGLRTHGPHRTWRTVGTILVIIVVAFTFAWFVPNIILLTGQGVTQLSAEQVETLTNWWVRLNWVRAVLSIVAWISALRALSIPPGTGEYATH
jgi:hypothetical protein